MVVFDIFFDGACQTGGQTKDRTGIGVAVYIDNLYSVEYSLNQLGDIGSNNIAEWCALIEALKIASSVIQNCKELELECKVTIYGDSQLIINQFLGNWEIKHPTFTPYFEKTRKIIFEDPNLKQVYIHWVPRESNRQADKLSKVALGKSTVQKDYLTLT